MAERLSKPTEDQLFGKFRKTGKPRYLSEVFDRTAPELLRVALHLARNPAQADDLVQSTFLEAIRGAKGWDPERRVLPWLLGILTNLARDARRQERRTLEEERLVPPKAAGPATEAEALEFTRAVDDAVQKMPDPYRPVLVLHLRHGLAPAEIGAALGRPSGTVRSQLARGLERLRRLLPAGFAAALAGLITPSRGLAAIREAVLAQAVPPAIVTTATGVLAMKKILTVCGLVLAALTLWMVSLEEGDAVPDNLDRESGAQTLRAAATGAVPAQTAVVEHRAPVETVDLGESATGSLLVRVLW